MESMNKEPKEQTFTNNATGRSIIGHARSLARDTGF